MPQQNPNGGLGSVSRRAAKLLRYQRKILEHLTKDKSVLSKCASSQQAKSFTEAADLYSRWPSFEARDKRRIIDSIIEKIVLTGDEIAVTLCYGPSCEDLTKATKPATYGNSQ